MMNDVTPEFDAICTWMGSQDQYITGSDMWAHELRSRISRYKNQLTRSELDSLNATMNEMKRRTRNLIP